MSGVGDIEQAVVLSLELAHDQTREELKVQVNNYLRELEASDLAWKYGLELFLSSKVEHARYYGISRVKDVLNDASRYMALSMEDKLLLREALMKWIHQAVANRFADERMYIQNTLAVILALMVKREYPKSWSNPFEQFLLFANVNSHGASLFLKVLEYISDQVVSQFTELQSKDDITIGITVRDQMRESSIREVVQFWFNILSNYRDLDPTMVKMCLTVMVDYIGWIDISFVVNDQFIPIFFHFLQNTTEFRIHAIKCLLEIVRKGMPAENKVQLLQHLNLTFILQQQFDKTRNDDNDDDSDIGWDFNENMSTLVSEIGLHLIDAKLVLPVNSPLLPYVLEQIATVVLPMALKDCLGCSSVPGRLGILDLLNKTLSIIRDNYDLNMDQKLNALAVKHPTKSAPKANRSLRRYTPTLTQPDMELDSIFRGILPSLLPLICTDMRYPTDFTFDPNDEFEQEFERHRQLLQGIFNNVTRCAPIDSVLPFLQSAVQRIDASSSPFDAEVLLTLLYSFGEGAPSGIITPTQRTLLEMAQLGNTHHKHSSCADSLPNDEAKAKAEDDKRSTARIVFRDLLYSVIHSGSFTLHPEPKVVSVYNDLIGRYCNLLMDGSNDFLPTVLPLLAGQGGLQHKDTIVRSHACYILLKVIQTAPPVAIIPYSGDLLLLLKESSMIRIEMVMEEKSQDQWFSADDVMNLMELSGIMIGYSEDETTMKERILLFLGPVHGTLNDISIRLSSCANSDERILLGEWAAECTRGVGLTAKGIGSKWRNGIDEMFKSCTDMSLRCLALIPEHDMLRSRILTLLHCLVSTIGIGSLQFTPGIAIRFLEQSNSLAHVLEAMQFVNQLLTKFKGNILPTLDSMFIPVVRRMVAVFQSVPDPFAPAVSPTGLTVMQREYRAVKRIFFHFFYTIAESKQDEILYSSTNGHHLLSVLQMVSEAMSSFPDHATQKTCVRTLHVLTVRWLESEGPPPQAVKDLFAMFLIDQATVASLRALRAPRFNVEDYECVALVDKICEFHQELMKVLGQTWAQSLVDTALPAVNGSRAIEYSQALSASLGTKRLRAVLLKTMF